jgi:TolB-like protein/DNA-binding winged helix-turn-helix (wHTH) protein
MTRPVRFDDWMWDPNTLELSNGPHVATLEPRVARLFEFMVAHPGELLSRDHLIDAVWDGRVVSDEAVRRAVFNLRQALAVGGSDSYIRTVHKKGYTATFPTREAVEPESQPVQPTSDDVVAIPHDSALVTPPPPPGQQVRQTRVSPALLAIIAIAMLCGAAWLYLDMPWRREPADLRAETQGSEPVAIAVLPMVNESREQAGQFLADGLTDELFAMLERNRDLRVTARGSAFHVENQQADTAELAQRLGVRYLLDGSISGGAEQLRVQLSLLDATKGVAIWADRYEAAASDWFALQQTITADTARAVQSRLRQDARALDMPRRAGSAEAQLEVLRARQLLITRSVADAEQAIEHLQRALTLDSNYALAYARLADAILIQAESTTGIMTARPVVVPLLDKALALDPELGEAYALRSQLADDPAAAERDLRRGLELNPSYARGYELLANVQARDALQLPQAVATIDSAIALDPLTPGNYHAKAMLMMGQGKWQEAAELDRRALALNPNYRAALTQLSMVYGVEGYFADAIEYARQAVALDPRAVPLREHLILMYLAVGDIEAARIADNPPTVLGSLAIRWAEGNVTELVESFYVEGQVPVYDAGTFMVSHILLRQAVSDGDYDRAVALLSPRLLTDGALRPQVSGWGLYAFVNLAQLLRLNGDIAAAVLLEEELAGRMVTMETSFPRHRMIHEQLRAILLASAGRGDEACAALNYSYTPNPRPYWKVILGNPAFDSMADAPCLQALRKRIDQYIAKERERIDAVKREDEAAKPVPANNDFSADATT